MSGGALFAAGLFVTLIVAVSIVPLLLAAVMDGRREEEARAATGPKAAGADAMTVEEISGVTA